jgi:hypothetical protein
MVSFERFSANWMEMDLYSLFGDSEHSAVRTALSKIVASFYTGLFARELKGLMIFQKSVCLSGLVTIEVHDSLPREFDTNVYSSL